MKKLRSQHYLLLILSVLALFISSAAYIFMYKDAVRKAEEEAAVQIEISAASKHTLEAENMETIYNDTIANRALLPSFFVSLSNAVPFIDAVESIGPATGAKVSISSLSTGASNDSPQGVVTANISADGTWPDVMHAVEMVENLPYAISLDSLDLNTSLDDSSLQKTSQQWTASLSISVLSSP